MCVGSSNSLFIKPSSSEHGKKAKKADLKSQNKFEQKNRRYLRFIHQKKVKNVIEIEKNMIKNGIKVNIS